MKKWLACLFLLLCATVIASTSQFTGEWDNTNAGASDFSKLIISGSGPKLSIKASGSCKTAACDWAPTIGTIYADSIHSNMAGSAQLLVGLFPTNQGEKYLLLKPTGPHRLRGEVLTRYRNSVQNNYVKTYLFTQKNVPKEKGDKKAAADLPLPPPRLVTPKNGKTYYHYPRKTLLKWKPVKGASSYVVEVDCYHCCRYKQWCSTLGHPWLEEKNITNTQFLFEFIGPQTARWRVWAVSASGTDGYKAPWQKFKYRR